MLNREGLYEELQSAVKKAAMQKKVSEIAGQLSEEYNIPEDLSSEYLIGKSQIRNAENDFFLFALSMKFIPDKLNKYFSETEIKQKSKQKFIVPKLKFPIELDMIKISDDQWIGKISAQELIKFRDAQVIKYNENTQRPLQLYISGEVEHFKITVNKKAVDDISDSFESNLYIPNTITLNVPMNTVIDDTISGKLIIKKTEDFKFDIIDGYHRYLAISREYNLNHNFNYQMELRIVRFDESRAKQFIWQEDQKTKMQRIASAAHNQNSLSTRIIQSLNSDIKFSLRGNVNPNSGIINSLILFNCLEVLYASKTVKKSDEFLFVMKTEEAIREFINHICILDPDKFHGKRWERELILATIYTCYKNIPPENALDYIEDYYKVLKEHPRLMGNTGRKYSKKDFNRLDAFRNERNLN